MQFINSDETYTTPTPQDLLKMAGVSEPNPKCYSIPEAIDVTEGFIDGEDPEEDPMAGAMHPMRLTLISLQIMAERAHQVLALNELGNDVEEDAMAVLRSLTELCPQKTN